MYRLEFAVSLESSDEFDITDGIVAFPGRQETASLVRWEGGNRIDRRYEPLGIFVSHGLGTGAGETKHI